MKREHGPEQLPREFDIQVGRRLRMARFGARLTPSELARMVGSDEAEIEILGNRQQRNLSRRADGTMPGAERDPARPAGLAGRLMRRLSFPSC